MKIYLLLSLLSVMAVAGNTYAMEATKQFSATRSAQSDRPNRISSILNPIESDDNVNAPEESTVFEHVQKKNKVQSRASEHTAVSRKKKRRVTDEADFLKQTTKKKDKTKAVQSPSESETDDFIMALREVSKNSVRLLVLKAWLRNGYDSNAKNFTGETALMVAASEGDLDSSKFLVARGADVDAKNKTGQTALILAVRGKHKNVTQFLIEEGADINSTTNSGHSALIEAIYKRDEELAQFLLEKGALCNNITNSGETSLSVAARRGSLSLVKALILRGAFSVADKHGVTPLMDAAAEGKLDIVRALCQHGDDIQAVDKFGRNALYYAVESKNLGVVKYLCKRGVNVNVIDKQGESPLSMALKDKRSEIVDELLLYKAKPAP